MATTNTLPAMRPAGRQRSKTLATWIALLGGTLGLHRFYLHGARDLWAWAHPLPSLIGLGGLVRMNTIGQDDHAAWLLVPLFGLMVAISMLSAIVIGLTPDEKWAERFSQPLQPSGWAAVLGVVISLLLGGAALMGALALGGQKFFEYQQEQAAAAPAPAEQPPAQNTKNPTQ